MGLSGHYQVRSLNKVSFLMVHLGCFRYTIAPWRSCKEAVSWNNIFPCQIVSLLNHIYRLYLRYKWNLIAFILWWWFIKDIAKSFLLFVQMILTAFIICTDTVIVLPFTMLIHRLLAIRTRFTFISLILRMTLDYRI